MHDTVAGAERLAAKESRAGAFAHQPWGPERRKSRYVDFRLQMRMLVALIVLETGGVIGALLYLYFRFSELILANMYRFHHEAESLYSLLSAEVGGVLLLLLGGNLLAIFVADRIWVRHVSCVIREFRLLANKVADLDFSRDSKPTVKHGVLERMLVWRTKERVRLRTFREELLTLHLHAGINDPRSQEQLRQRLLLLRQILPEYSSQYLDISEKQKTKTLGGSEPPPQSP
ncbi:MAG: hypothetical protein H7836_00365, partial [Magnetococcus sp. YQC-3]